MVAFRRSVLLGVALCLVACGDHEFHPPDREAQVARADSMLAPAAFDTITWANDSTRLFVGNNTYAAKCRRCHGFLGRGETDYTRVQGIDVPSLVRPEWEYADDLQGLRRIIFIGHPEGMPTWGVAGISPREIDAAAYYILHQLRPDVLGRDG